ncbi:MAG: T9SS type A sorting domain-containing protein, partial [Bacteroidales bacterium]|nr:T9SS type A sorting domain-containing protein [Bacteroidales bacterium]
NYFIIDNIENASMINVYNSIGKAVINKDCRELNRVEIDATILESGLYYVSIYYNDGQVVSKPISIVK